MKNKIGVLLFFLLTITGITFGQTVPTVPTGTGNDRFLEEYHSSMIRPGLSLNGFDNGGNDSTGLGLKQVLNEALSGDTYIKDKLNEIFDRVRDDFYYSNPTDNQIESNSIILQYTAFEALASYVLEHNNIDSVDSNTNGLNIRSHSTAVDDLFLVLVKPKM
jgi:hypothetical protein